MNKQLSLWDGTKGGQSHKSTCPHDNHWSPAIGLQEVVPHLLTHTVVGSTICGQTDTPHCTWHAPPSVCGVDKMRTKSTTFGKKFPFHVYMFQCVATCQMHTQHWTQRPVQDGHMHTTSQTLPLTSSEFQTVALHNQKGSVVDRPWR